MMVRLRITIGISHNFCLISFITAWISIGFSQYSPKIQREDLLILADRIVEKDSINFSIIVGLLKKKKIKLGSIKSTRNLQESPENLQESPGILRNSKDSQWNPEKFWKSQKSWINPKSRKLIGKPEFWELNIRDSMILEVSNFWDFGISGFWCPTYLKWAIFAIASLVKWITSIAEASSFTESDKKSINNGITFAATSEKKVWKLKKKKKLPKLQVASKWKYLLIQFEHFWTSLNMFDQVWTRWIKLDPVWSSFTQFEHVWTSLINLDLV